MKAVLIGAALAAVLGLTAAQAQEPAAPSQTQEVQQLADRWTQAYNSNSKSTLGALYTEDARLYLHGHPTVAGRRAIEAYWAEDMQVDSPLTVLNVTNAVNGFDMRLVHGNYQVINRKTGVPLSQGRFAHIWTRVDGQWRLDRDLWNQPAE